MKTMINAALVAVSLLGLVACGNDKKKDDGSTGKTPATGGETAPKDDGGEAPASGSKAYVAAEHKGSVSGTVKLGGAAPDARTLAIAGDAFCTSALEGQSTADEDWVVNADGTVPNAVVWVKSGASEGYKFTAPTDRDFTVKQHNCFYVPHVFTVMVGEKFHVENTDATQHNVHTKPQRATQFNKAQNHGDKDELVFEKKESKPVPFSCDIHSWMSAQCIVLEHPFAAVTDDKGHFEIKGLPAGEYEFSVWTNKLGKGSFKATIADAAVTQDVTLAK